jgi:uncharacterized protein
LVSTVDNQEKKGVTTVNLQRDTHHATDIEQQTFEKEYDSMRQGWGVGATECVRSQTCHNLTEKFKELSDMKPRITVITLGVDDLERSLAFYRDGLGLPTQGIIGTEYEHGAVVFFDLNAGLKLAIWPRASLAHDSGLALGCPSAMELSIGHNVASTQEVDAVMEQARQAGAVIVKAAQPTFWGGYGGYFQDPDHHLWEIVWNPQFDIVD